MPCNVRQRLRRLAAARAVVAVLFVACASAAAASAQDARRPLYTNPVIAGDFPDPTVIRTGQDFWAATTTGTWAPHFPVLHSRDLVNWRVVGYVFRSKPAWAKGDFWAPEMVEDRGRFFIYYTARRDEGPRKTGTLCVAVATAARAEGPYADHGPLVCEIRELKNVGSIDAFFVRDENGRPYLVWKADGNDAEPDQPTSIFAQQLTEDGTRLVGRRGEILRNTEPWERHVTEGSYILRRGGWFYHFYSGNACCGRGCDYALGVARARKLLGPWEKHPRNPILDDNQDWQCPGHGSIVTTPDGRDFLLYHSYRRRRDTFNVGRESLLDEVTWGADGWPAINGGRGPSSANPSPLGATESDDEREVFDGFDSRTLDPEWQWPMFVRQSVRVGSGGRLVLTPVSNPKGDEIAGAVLARKTVSGDYTATARVDARATHAAARAGLAAYSWRDAAVGLALGGGMVTVWRREGREQKTVASAPAPNSEFVQLRMTAEGGESYRFAFSADGRAWTQLGGEVNGSHVEGARVALTAGGRAPGASAAFDWVQITPRRAPRK
jgi:xylan 1,4-beta-xylosidase